jgi:hypothetical protein
LNLKSAKLNDQSDEIFKDIARKMVFELHGKHVEKPAVLPPSLSIGPRPRSIGKVGF